MDRDQENTTMVSRSATAVISAGIRSLAASFPVCATLGQAWSEYEAHRTGRRIEELFQNLHLELEEVRSALEERGECSCNDFPELLEITIERVKKEFEGSKREAYARVLSRLIVDTDQRAFGSRIALIESLDTLSECDLRVLQLFEKTESASIGELHIDGLQLSGDANEQIWQLACNLAKLESRGLILKVSTHTGSMHVPQGLSKETARWRETKYRVLPLGRSLIQALFR